MQPFTLLPFTPVERQIIDEAFAQYLQTVNVIARLRGVMDAVVDPYTRLGLLIPAEPRLDNKKEEPEDSSSLVSSEATPSDKVA
jgi:hypothetical protein